MGEFTKVLRPDITIVTLLDKQVYSREALKKQPVALFGSIMVMMRAHDESKTKGQRVGQVWEKKRRLASSAVLTARVPGWLRAVGDGEERRIEFKEHGREVVRRIFDDSLLGYGKDKVAKRLRKVGYETFEGGKTWYPSYVQKVLRNRATFGEMQPYKRDEEGRRVPAGPPIKDYYPAAVTGADFLRASAAPALRDKSGGRREATGEVNLLRDLARCTCGGRMKRENICATRYFRSRLRHRCGPSRTGCDVHLPTAQEAPQDLVRFARRQDRENVADGHPAYASVVRYRTSLRQEVRYWTVRPPRPGPPP